MDGEFTVKTYRIGMKAGKDERKHRFVALEPANPNYPTITITPGHELLTFGKVTAVIHRLWSGLSTATTSMCRVRGS